MKKGSTELVFIIDRSGSMSGLEDDTIGGFNAMLQEQKAVEGEAVVTTVLFSDGRELLHDRINIQAVAPLTRADYTVGGSTALLDAITEAANIGIAADRAQNFCADSAGTSSVYTSMSAMSTAFRTGKPISSIDMMDAAEPQSAKAALENLKRVAKGFSQSAKELMEETEELSRVAEANGGKLPDVNEIIRKILAERNEEDG